MHFDHQLKESDSLLFILSADIFIFFAWVSYDNDTEIILLYIIYNSKIMFYKTLLNIKFQPTPTSFDDLDSYDHSVLFIILRFLPVKRIKSSLLNARYD